jgi:hypothetical protein
MRVRELYPYPVIVVVAFLRVAYLVAGHQWHDIQNGIDPALRCFYCNPVNAPYGLLWWLVSLPLRFNYGLLTAIVDIVIMILIRAKTILFPVYSLMSWWLWLQAPYDVPVLWLSSLGLIGWPLAFLGPLSKLPVGAPANVWGYVLGRSFNVNDLEYYSMMGAVFLAVLVQKVREIRA